VILARIAIGGDAGFDALAPMLQDIGGEDRWQLYARFSVSERPAPALEEVRGKVTTFLTTPGAGERGGPGFMQLKELGNFAGGRNREKRFSKPPPSASRPHLRR
jgi:hypothetical protein